MVIASSTDRVDPHIFSNCLVMGELDRCVVVCCMATNSMSFVSVLRFSVT